MDNVITIEHGNQRVLTTQQLAEIYETSTDNIKMNFNRNKERFKEGKHYFLLKGEDLRSFKNKVTDSYSVPKNVNQLLLWTEKGADRHCKILDTDKAWEQFDNLEETYFRVKASFEYPRTLPEALRAYADEVEQNEKLKLENSIKDQQIGELQPKADYVDKILHSTSLVTISQIAADYGMSGQKMNEVLHDYGVQFKQSGQWLLYMNYKNLGYTFSQTTDIHHSDGTTTVKMNTKWTQKGRLFLYELLKHHGIIPTIERLDDDELS